MTVSAFETTVTEALEMFGWRHMHVRPVFDGRRKRWVTPTTAIGWPDLCAVHPLGVVLAAEVKGTTGRDATPTPEQLDWLRAWHAVACAAAVVLRPSDDFDAVCRWLRDPWLARSGFGWLPEPEQRRVGAERVLSPGSGGRPGTSGSDTRRRDHITPLLPGATSAGHHFLGPGVVS